MSEAGALALELEVLVARALRGGRLEPQLLIPAYTALAPTAHALAGEARRLDLEALVRGLEALPAEAFAAAEVLVVPRLADYPYAPATGELRAGTLPDGTVLLEATLGPISVLDLAAALCALRLESAKAAALLATPGGPDEPLARLAFAWGTDPLHLAAANDATRGLLLRLLTGGAALPEVRLHPELTPEARRHSNRRRAERLLARLAEMGLAARPIHLWIGDAVVTDVLSPYARELRQALAGWAGTRPEALGEDVAAAISPPSEDVAYAIAHDFVATDAALAEERGAAERSAGLWRLALDGLEVEVVDLARVDTGVLDARLGSWQPPAPAPVLVRLPEEVGDPDATLLRTLVAALGSTVTGVTLVQEGTVPASPAGTIVLPTLMVRAAGESKLVVPNRAPLEPADFHGFADATVRRVALLAASSARLVSATRLRELSATLDVGAITIGGDGTLAALTDALFEGTLRAPVGWVFVATRQVRTGRPDLASLGGLSAVAIAALRRLVPQPEPAEQHTKRRPPPRASGRGSIRIKA